MSELRDAAQELLDYYDRLAAKYGRIAEYKAVKVKIDRLRKALAEDEVEAVLGSNDVIATCLADGSLLAMGRKWVSALHPAAQEKKMVIYQADQFSQYEPWTHYFVDDDGERVDVPVGTRLRIEEKP